MKYGHKYGHNIMNQSHMVEITQIRHERQSKVESKHNPRMTYVGFFHIYGQFPIAQNILEIQILNIYGDFCQKLKKHQT